MPIDKTDYYIAKVLHYAKKLEKQYKRKQREQRKVMKSVRETFTPQIAKFNRDK